MPATVRASPKVYRLSVRVNDDHGGPVAAEVQDEDHLANSGSRHILLLVHGFNNTAEDARVSYALQMNLLRPGFDESNIAPDAVAHFQWPGDLAGPFRFTDALRYPDDIAQALESAERLAAFLAQLPRPGGDATALKVSFIGHSLGCRLILEALDRLSRSAPSFDVMSLMAAAVPVELVGSNGPLVRRAPVPRRTLKLFSERDLVLRFAFPAGQLLARIKGIEPTAYREAIGLHGNPAGFGEPKRRTNTHGEYWSDAYAAGTFVSAVDPTIPPPTDSREVVGRDLPTASEIPVRNLPTRDLPN